MKRHTRAIICLILTGTTAFECAGLKSGEPRCTQRSVIQAAANSKITFARPYAQFVEAMAREFPEQVLFLTDNFPAGDQLSDDRHFKAMVRAGKYDGVLRLAPKVVSALICWVCQLRGDSVAAEFFVYLTHLPDLQREVLCMMLSSPEMAAKAEEYCGVWAQILDARCIGFLRERTTGTRERTKLILSLWDGKALERGMIQRSYACDHYISALVELAKRLGREDSINVLDEVTAEEISKGHEDRKRNPSSMALTGAISNVQALVRAGARKSVRAFLTGFDFKTDQLDWATDVVFELRRHCVHDALKVGVDEGDAKHAAGGVSQKEELLRLVKFFLSDTFAELEWDSKLELWYKK
ncbi:MAG: hypothetical protein KBG84_15690 [Planctomycetes bacterium]|nr:hypothetical protein [Planctomycetota bacterium]